MFLRNKLAILSITLMSFMTIPTLAENDTSPVTSRIENTKFDVQVKTPEGWSQTKEFDTEIPDAFEFEGQIFTGIKFRNGTENHGCAVFFAGADVEDDEDDSVEESLAEFQEIVFPGSKLVNVTGKIDLKGTVEGELSGENPSKFKISGSLEADSTKGDFAVGIGSVVLDGAVSLNGTTGVYLTDDYVIITVMWGSEEESQVIDTQRFLQAVTVTPKASEEVIFEIVSDAVVISELTSTATSDVVIEEDSPEAST